MSDTKLKPQVNFRIDPFKHKEFEDALRFARHQKSDVLTKFIEAYIEYVNSEYEFNFPESLKLDNKESLANEPKASAQKKSDPSKMSDHEILKAAERIAEETVRKLMKEKNKT